MHMCVLLVWYVGAPKDVICGNKTGFVFTLDGRCSSWMRTNVYVALRRIRIDYVLTICM